MFFQKVKVIIKKSKFKKQKLKKENKMAVNPQLQPIYNPSEELKHPDDTILNALFSVLYSTGEKMAPWLEPTFWANTLNKEFRDRFFQELFKNLSSIGPNDANAGEFTSQIIITIYHCVFSFHIGFAKQLILPYYDKLLTTPARPEIKMMLLYLEKHSSAINFPNILERIITTESQLSLDNVIPTFTFYGLLHILRYSNFKDPKMDLMNQFLDAVLERTKKAMSYKSVLTFNHMMMVVSTLFPDLDRKKLNELKDKLSYYLSLSSPYSDVSYDTIEFLNKNVNFPGHGFYQHLYTMSQMSDAFSGQVPLFFDAKLTLASTMLYNDTADRASLPSAYLQWVRYFIYRYFGAMPPQNGNELIRFMQNVRFNETFMKTVPADYKLMKIPQDPKFARPVPPTMPQFQHNIYRMTSVVVDGKYPVIFTLATLSQIKDNNFLIGSLTGAKLMANFFNPLLSYFQQNPDVTEQQIVIVGDDDLLANIIDTLTIFIIQNSFLANIEFQFYFIPVGPSQFGDYIAENDQVYKQFVRNLYETTTRILPGYEENSQAFFPSFAPSPDQVGNYENNIWFNIPSPSHLFQYGIQHYMQFAKKKIDIYLWQCIIQVQVRDGNQMVVKLVSVPFINSVHIELNDKARSFMTKTIDFGKKEPIQETFETKVLSIYNISIERRAWPSKDHIVLDTGSSRVVSSVSVHLPRGAPPVSVIIDNHKFTDVLGLNVSFLPRQNITTIEKTTLPMRMKIKTFVDMF
ncbi:hypothetical protein TRFO_39376 [Tritrichomonas foetus]|uniref:Uncharacterized protein n=1 Tax=Tritrichomonas foetus TaxID=1144522 RepID=A0A1J4J9V5_9EUKA|nr:hypothetical protein TRFO_39376 [Tritrichomonas foetus]|eukprot:OHS94427.1 hypothetical protein TRFO_39376 [Tritrichomonas foetus]